MGVSGKIFKEQGIGILISGAAATVPSNMPVASVDVCLWGDCVAKLVFSLRTGLGVNLIVRCIAPRLGSCGTVSNA
jgi:hypothetical protein